MYRKPHRFSSFLCLITVSIFFTGCGSNQYVSRIPEEFQQSPEPPANELLRFDKPLTLQKAFSDGYNLYLKYQDIDKKVYYGVTNKESQQSLVLQAKWAPVYQVFQVEEEKYIEAVSSLPPLPKAGVDDWEELSDIIVDELTPESHDQGILVNIRDREWFVYRSRDDQLVYIDLFEKPPTIPLIHNYRIEELNEQIFDGLEKYLTKQNITDRVFVFATGETGPYARPFAVIDMDEREWGMLSLEPFTFGSMPNNFVTTGGKVGFHYVRSYLLDPINRPVSNFSRLSFFLADTVLGAIKETYIDLFSFPNLDASKIPPIDDGPGMDLNSWEKHLDVILGIPESSGNIELLVDGDAFFPRFIDEVIGAEKSIKMRTYIFDRDDYAVNIADLLKKRSAEIEVKILLDGLGTLLAQERAAGSMPPDHEAPLGITTYLVEESQVKLRSQTNPWFTGDHVKTTIIDSKVAFIGGMNIGREYRWEWHDLMMEVRGPIVQVIEREFDKAWAHASILGDYVFAGYVLANRPMKQEQGGYPIRIIRTLPYRSEIFHAQLDATRRANKYIYIHNPYLSDMSTLYELAKARLRGVDVRVLLPMEGNHGIMNKSNVVAANILLKYGVRVYAFPGMSHVKSAVYDGWASLGSANFDKLSFRVNKEMNLATSDPGFVQELLDEVFNVDFAESVEITKPLPVDWSNTFAFIVASQL